MFVFRYIRRSDLADIIRSYADDPFGTWVHGLIPCNQKMTDAPRSSRPQSPSPHLSSSGYEE
jgi:hypothetical protein